MKFFKLLIAVCLFGLLFYFVDLHLVVEIFLQINLGYLIALILFSFVLIWASCLKWQLFLKETGSTVSIVYLMKLYIIGYFFNTFAPSSLGGDVARSVMLGNTLQNKKNAYATTFLERFTGLFALAFLGTIFTFSSIEIPLAFCLAIYAVFLITLFFTFVCFSKSISNIFFSFVAKYCKRFGKLAIIFTKIEQAFEFAHGKRKLFIKAMLLSFFFHLLTVCNTFIAARAIGWEDPAVIGLFLVVPLILLVGMIPITPNGLGLQEGAFMYFLQLIGSSFEQGMSIGLLLRAKVTLLALFGGLLWLTAFKSNSALQAKIKEAHGS